MLSLEEVEHIAQLARLNLTAEEKELYRTQLSAILDYAARLQSLDTDGVPPTSSVLGVNAPLRADEPRKTFDIGEVLLNTSDSADDQFKVPPVFE